MRVSEAKCLVGLSGEVFLKMMSSQVRLVRVKDKVFLVKASSERLLASVIVQVLKCLVEKSLVWFG